MGIYQPKYKDQKTGEVKTAAIWWASVFSMGKRERFSTGTESKAEAMRIYRERAGDADKGIQTPKNVRRVKFYEIAETVIGDYKINEWRSLEEVETRLRLHILPYFGDALCLNITPGDVESYKLKRKEAGAANATINRELSIIKRAFSLAIRQGKLLQRPHIAMLSEAHNVRQGFPTPEQFNAVIGQIEAMPEDRFPRVARAIAIVLKKSGWRTSELLGNKRRGIKRMVWSQVNFADRTLSLLISKNKKPRIIPMKGQLLEVLQEMRAYTDRVQKENGVIIPWVFHRDGEPIAGIVKIWKEATRKAGCPGLLCCDFRRGTSRDLMRCPGISQSVAMEWTGHKTASVFKRYNIVDLSDLDRAASALEALAAAESETVKVTSKCDDLPAAVNA